MMYDVHYYYVTYIGVSESAARSGVLEQDIIASTYAQVQLVLYKCSNARKQPQMHQASSHSNKQRRIVLFEDNNNFCP
jgi:hypothetical protein